MDPILLTIAGNPENQDRGLILGAGPRTLLCVADGAGGRSGGKEAAIMAVEFFRADHERLQNHEDCLDLLRRMDAAMDQDQVAGETTFAMALVTTEEIIVASVGDSGIWLIPATGNWINLTVHQQRKPMIGSGDAKPAALRYPRFEGTLLLATDGLLKYTSADRIVETCRGQPANTAAQSLTELVKYPSGNYPDDVTLILMPL